MGFVRFCLYLVMLAFCLNFLVSHNTVAMTADWSGEFHAKRIAPHKQRYNMPCDGSIKRIELSTGDIKIACVYGKTNTSRVASFVSSDSSLVYALAKPYETSFKTIDRCKGNYGCLYSHRYDVLLEVDRYGVRIYRDFSSHPNRSSSEYVLESITSTFSPKIALSKNARYVGVLMPKSGYFILDLETDKVRQVYHEPNITSSKYLIAVSSDGDTIAGYENTRAFIIAANNCGVDIDDKNRRGTFSILDMCVVNHLIDIHFSFQRLDIDAISFTRDNHSLRFDARYSDGVNYIVVVRLGDIPSSAYPRDVKYFALGDSFTSGEGETDNKRYINHSDREYDKCHVSDRSYPFLLINYWSVDGQNLSCSGAVIADLLGSDDYKGQGRRLGSGGYKYSPEVISQKKDEAIGSFVPGRVAQLDFVSRYNPDVISISVGGNDAGLMTKLSACLGLGTCDWASDDGKRKTVKEIRRLYLELAELFQEVAEAYPTTVVYIVGYPMPLYAEGSCDVGINILLNKQERVYVANTIKYLNSVIEAAASKFNLNYIDVESAYSGSRICESASHPAMNFIRFGNDIAPFLGIKIIGAESFHPTPFGHELVFNKIKTQVPFPAADSFSCAYCDQYTDNIPPPPSGLKDATANTPVSIHQPDMSDDNIAPGTTIAVKVPEEIFLKSSTVTLAIKSDPVVLASDIPLSDTIEVTVPDIEGGVHTLVLSGTLQSGEPLELYKSVYVAPKKNTQPANSSVSKSEALMSSLPRKTKNNPSETTDSDAAVLGVTDKKVYTLTPSIQVTQKDPLPEAKNSDQQWYEGDVWTLLYLVFFVGCGVCRYRYLRR